MSEGRLMVIGSRGFVGAHVAHAAGSQFEMVSDGGIDITRIETVRSAFDERRPDAVVLTAAISDIDRCEREPEKAEKVNVAGAKIVAYECRRIGARFLFTSTGAVFDGIRHGYTEDDAPTPISVYGDTKARAERIVFEVLPSAIIVRLSLVLGFGITSGTNALLDKLVASFRNRHSVLVPAEEYRNPIDVETLNGFLLELVRRPGTQGLYHLGASDSQSRFDLVSDFARRMNAPQSLVVRQTLPVSGRAPRGRDHFLISKKISETCGRPLPTCEQTMERCLSAITQSHT
jgi:dTDP-4-dehydrorhamnose reductase